MLLFFTTFTFSELFGKKLNESDFYKSLDKFLVSANLNEIFIFVKTFIREKKLKDIGFAFHVSGFIVLNKQISKTLPISLFFLNVVQNFLIQFSKNLNYFI